MLGYRILDILRWQPFSSVEIIVEHSERLALKIEEVFGDLNLREEERLIHLEFSWMSKSAGEPGPEVADFLANSIVTEVRHRIAKQPSYAKNFEAFLHHRSGRMWRTQPNGQASKGKSE